MGNSRFVGVSGARPKELFYSLLVLTTVFLLLEVSFFLQNYRDFLADGAVVLDQLKFPAHFIRDVALFLMTQLLIHFIYCVSIWVVVLSVLKLFPRLNFFATYFAISIWLLITLTILLANAIFFPNSKFAELVTVILFSPIVLNVIFIILLTCSFFILLLTIISNWKFKPYLMLFVTSTIVLIMIYNSYNNKNLEKHLANFTSLQYPNIILVGVDALRPDFLGFFGRTIQTPFIDSFLKNSVVFSQTVTPLARTFPSWTSILTGRYPKEVNIRTNLAEQQFADLSDTLPKILQKKGYYTLYATDETRFSNIGSQFGFNRVISPTVGLSDFVLGTMNDFPLSNFLINTGLGKQLFPYSYGNRAAYVTYQPDSFLNLLRPSLTVEQTRPLFLAIHFCLPHYPYLWAELAGQDNQILEHYQLSIERVDEQLNSLFQLLEQNGILQQAVVVLVSDHGETLGLSGDRITEKELFLSLQANELKIPKFYPAGSDGEAVNQAVGHGTDVLALPQYHSLFAIKRYGFATQQKKQIKTTVSLLDIKPTILALLQIPDSKSSGQSLAAYVNGWDEVNLKHYPIFLESDFSPSAILQVFPDVHQTILQGINIFKIDLQTAHLIVKSDMLAKILQSKQYAVIDGEWMLALYPQNNHQYTPVLVNLNSGMWTIYLQSSFAKSSPVKKLLTQLKRFYGSEINSIVDADRNIFLSS